MEAKIWISNLDRSTTEEELDALFSEYGTVVEVIIDREPEAGRKTLNALVEMATEAEASDALDGLNGYRLNRRTLELDWFDQGDEDVDNEEYDEDFSDDDDLEEVVWEDEEEDFSPTNRRIHLN